ncbi:hypothetical protein EUTSA_v10022919mg [Eutrema salsugineum]|uniref:Uncharacterized protein n=1 Tax=Eutrema salsugineum TaxID=72664 RepID=V4MDR6_EUTSA|nr:hypothetical protein EUTSA_v10022919mg [Eutrema salsugineum]
MQMLRTLSTRSRSRRSGYELVGDSYLGAKLRRSTSVPYYAPSIRLGGGLPAAILEELPRQKSKKTVVTSKSSHPIFSLFHRSKKKATAKPEFSRFFSKIKWDELAKAYIYHQK